MYSIIHFLTATLLLTTTTTAQPPSQNPLSTTPQPYPSFTIGFDLTASHGTAAISFPNFTLLTLPPIPASLPYTSVLHRLSLPSSRHPSPPYSSISDSWSDMPRQTLRHLRKNLGLPASSDVGELSTLLSALRSAVEEKLGEPITEAAVTTMNLIALYDEDLRDAFEYVGLKYITFPVGYVGHNILYETSAAYAGYGFGLCSASNHETDPKACHQEEADMPDETVMAVLYTDTVLAVSLSILRSAYTLWEPQYRYLTDFSLGYNALLLEKNEAKTREDEYWKKVEGKLQQIMLENPGYERPGKVLLMGDRAGNRKFAETLVKALGEQMEVLPEILGEGAVGVAARGVAVMGGRVRGRYSDD